MAHEEDCKTLWYLCEDSEEAAQQMEAAVKSIEADQYDRISDCLRSGSLYLNKDMMSMSSAGESYLVQMPVQILNAIQPIVDTAISKHVEAETKVSFSVDNGDFEASQNAEDMDRFCWGEFNRLRLYEKSEKALKNALIFGDGWLKWYPRKGRAAVDCVFSLEIYIDNGQCVGTEPTEMYQVRYVPRSWARAQWKEKAVDIDLLPQTYPPYAWPGTDTDVVRLVEGWHLASDDGESDGRHVISCGPINILDEVWEYTSFPFSRISYNPALIGAYSQSLVDQLAPLQLELGKMMKRIQHSLHLMSVPRIWQNSSTKISPEYNNAIGNVYKFTGTKPEIDASPSVNPELYAQADRIYQRMQEVARTNPMQSGNMPSRFDSRPALREAQEIADQPHAWLGVMWQRLFVESGRQLVRVARQVVEEHGTYKTFGKSRDFIEKIDFADCNLEDDRFEITPTPTSLLPTTVSGKRIVVEDMFTKGLIEDPNDAWELLAGMPDVDSFKSEKTAQKRLVDKQIYLMIKKRQNMRPDQCQDPVYCKRRVQAQLQLLLTKEGVPDDVWALLDNYIQECDNLYELANPPAPPPLPDQQGMMPGAPAGAMPNGPVGILPPGPPGAIGPPAGAIPAGPPVIPQ